MKDRRRYYQKTLEKQTKKYGGFDYAAPAEELINKRSGTINETFLCVTSQVTSPVLTSYVIWVLHDAMKRKISTLLFIARDGYVMYRIGKVICEKWGWDIECKYFYASRQSLRLPLYAIDKEYALKKHCEPESENNTAQSILIAAGLTPNETEDVLGEINLSADIKTQLEKSQLFAQYSLRASSKALAEAKGYFNQNVPSAPSAFALVDSGWSGSIQVSFGKLYQHFTGHSANKIVGYYFGLLVTPPPDSGIYNSYYFSPSNGFSRFKSFSMDLFECLCAAEGGRTVGYKQEDNNWLPILTQEKITPNGYWNAKSQIDMCVEYADIFTQYNKSSMPLPDMSKTIYSLFRAFMQNPTREEAEIYGAIPFSRGVLENNTATLARRLTSNEVKLYSFAWRLRRSVSRHKEPIENPVFWLQGALALSEISLFKRLNVKLLLFAYWAKMEANKIKEGKQNK